MKMDKIHRLKQQITVKKRERESRHTLASTDEKEAIRSDRTVKQIHNRT
jgi:hypothetical protein